MRQSVCYYIVEIMGLAEKIVKSIIMSTKDVIFNEIETSTFDFSSTIAK